MPCTEEQFQEMPLDFVRDEQAIVSLTAALENDAYYIVYCMLQYLQVGLQITLQMWNNGTLYPIKGMFVDDSVCPVVPKVCQNQRYYNDHHLHHNHNHH